MMLTERQRLFLRSAAGSAAIAADLGRLYSNDEPTETLGFFEKRRLEMALSLVSDNTGSKAIHFGCGGGAGIAEVASRFTEVAGVDIHPGFVRHYNGVARRLGLSNVHAICNRGRSMADIAADLSSGAGSGYRTLLLLNVLPHVGKPGDLWGTKTQFLSDAMSLLEPDGRMIVSVPKMVGLPMLAKHLARRAAGLRRDRMPLADLLRSGLRNDTDRLESLWHGGNIGFNHLKLEPLLTEHFHLQHRSETLGTVFYVLTRQIRKVSVRRPAFADTAKKASSDIWVTAAA